MRERLRKLIRETTSALGAAVVNSDGVVVVVETTDVMSEPASGLSEYGMVLEQLSAVNEVLGLGKSVSCQVDSDQRTTLIRRLNQHYFVALWLSGSQDADRAAFQLRLASTDLTLLNSGI
jgi:predicted regulator of Ras-like GTPase activity (Roadblock/LC7/MglB family)